MSEPAVTMYSIDPGLGSLLRERFSSNTDVSTIVMPARQAADGVGEYWAEDLTAVKLLRSAGVAADFLHSADKRTGVSEFSTVVVLSFAVGVAQNMTWDAAKAICQYVWMRAGMHARPGKVPGIDVKVTRFQRDGDHVELEGLSVTGLADDTTATVLMRVLMGEQPKVESD